MAIINELYARWRILEICNEAAVLARSIGDHQIADLAGAAALKAAESVEAPRVLVERMQRDLALRPDPPSRGDTDSARTKLRAAENHVARAAKRLN